MQQTEVCLKLLGFIEPVEIENLGFSTGPHLDTCMNSF